MEELVEGALKGLLRLVSLFVRGLVFSVYDFFFEVIAWYIGWPIVRAITFNHYPTEKIGDYEKASVQTGFIVSIIGFVALIASAILLAKLIIVTGV